MTVLEKQLIKKLKHLGCDVDEGSWEKWVVYHEDFERFGIAKRGESVGVNNRKELEALFDQIMAGRRKMKK